MPPVSPVTGVDQFVKIMVVLTPILIAVFGSLFALVQIWIGNRANAAAKKAEAAEEQSAKRDEAVRIAAEKAAEKAEEVKEVLKAATGNTDGKLDIIHSLSNSALTASMKSDENSQTLNILMMEEMLEFKKSSGGNGLNKDTLATLTKAKGRVEELRSAIAEREKQQAVVDSKIAEGLKSAGPTPVLVVNPEPLPVRDVEKK